MRGRNTVIQVLDEMGFTATEVAVDPDAVVIVILPANRVLRGFHT